MAVGRIPDFIDGFYRRVRGRIESNGEIRSGQVVVNRSRNTHDGDTRFLFQLNSPSEGAVSTDDYQAIKDTAESIGLLD